MSEPFLERMSRFTPDVGGLDRDALLFAAGRRSACPNRGWIALGSLLGGTQALTLLLLWPQPALPGSRLTVPVARVDARVAASPASPASAQWSNSGLWTARRRLQAPVTHAPPDSDTNWIESGPVLRAFPPPPSLLN